MRSITLQEFQSEVRAQGVAKEDLAFRCPMCGTIQSARDLVAAGAGADFDAVEKYLAFSCVGRWQSAPSGFKSFPAGYQGGCDWTLGGLFGAAKLEVVTPDGAKHARFELCTPDEAKRHAERTPAAIAQASGAA